MAAAGFRASRMNLHMKGGGRRGLKEWVNSRSPLSSFFLAPSKQSMDYSPHQYHANGDTPREGENGAKKRWSS